MDIFGIKTRMRESSDTPILFCIFNRPDLTSRVFEAIRQRRPQTLLIAGDGPRVDHPDDTANVEAARRIVSQIDWPCHVQTRFLSENLGCKHAMSSAISWGFEQAEQLIILEDDCLPDPSFFGYCESLLERYRDNEDVMMISGNNFQKARHSDASYYFSRWTHIWGWATWKSAWQHFDVNISSWPTLKQTAQLRSIFKNPTEYAHWSRTLDMQHAGSIDTWDFPWAYSVWSNNGLSILPEKNLVTNIGFGSDATHTTDPESKLAAIPVCDIGMLLHPLNVKINEAADRHTWKSIFQPSAGVSSAPKPFWPRKLNLFRRRKQKLTEAA